MPSPALLGSSARILTPTPPPPDPAWPDEFMSYDDQPTVIHLNNVHGTAQDPYIIEYLSFEGFERPNPRPIWLEDCSHILIRRIDTRHCTMGLVYALNSNDITVERCRAENIASEFAGWYLGGETDPARDGRPWFQNNNDCNFWQFDKCYNVTVRDVKGRYGQTEDVGSLYTSHDALIERFQWQGGIALDQPTSDDSPSTMWSSSSGTGHILGDNGGYNLTVRDSSFLDAGQVCIQHGGGQDCTFDNCVAYGTGYTTQGWNTGATTWAGTPPMTGHKFLDCRVQYFKENGDSNPVWFDPSAETPETTGSVFGDGTLVRDDYIVTL